MHREMDCSSKSTPPCWYFIDRPEISGSRTSTHSRDLPVADIYTLIHIVKEHEMAIALFPLEAQLLVLANGHADS